MIVRDRPGALTLMFVVRGTILTAVYPQLLILLLFALLIQAVHEWQWLVIPEFSSSPFALLGVAMSIFLGFRNNAAYERWWEGRMQWGRIIDQVRSIARSSETLLALLKRELSPIKAYTKGELKVKASFRDLLMMKKFF